ncbi:hypothetical protein D9M73_283650 [compost metagenome]
MVEKLKLFMGQRFKCRGFLVAIVGVNLTSSAFNAVSFEKYLPNGGFIYLPPLFVAS